MPYARTARTLAALAALTALGTAGATGTAGPAAAVVKPVCNLIVDAVGDASPQADALDIRAGDIASGATTVVGVLRLRRLGGTDAVTLTGTRWQLGFTVQATRYTFDLANDLTGLHPALVREPAGGPATSAPVAVTYDVSRSTITWTAPRGAISELPATPAGDPVTGLAARTAVTPADQTADVATSPATYPDGYPSCVRAA